MLHRRKNNNLANRGCFFISFLTSQNKMIFFLLSLNPLSLFRVQTTTRKRCPRDKSRRSYGWEKIDAVVLCLQYDRIVFPGSTANLVILRMTGCQRWFFLHIDWSWSHALQFFNPQKISYREWKKSFITVFPSQDIFKDT